MPQDISKALAAWNKFKEKHIQLCNAVASEKVIQHVSLVAELERGLKAAGFESLEEFNLAREIDTPVCDRCGACCRSPFYVRVPDKTGDKCIHLTDNGDGTTTCGKFERPDRPSWCLRYFCNRVRGLS